MAERTQPIAEPIAIVGMACMFPSAPDLDAYWKNLCTGVDAVRDAPAARIDPAFFGDSSSRAFDRFYAKRGGFLDGLTTFDAAHFGVMPVAARSAEPDQLLTLQIAAQALADAGYDDRPFARDRAAVILGRGGYCGAGRTRLDQQVRGGEQLVAALRALVPGLDEATLDRVKAEFQAQLGAEIGEGAIGLVPNLAASRVANRLDLRGPAYTVDAACASALVAVDQSCRELQSGRSDLVIAGGVYLSQDETFWSVFCQLGALSRNGEIRPFDRRADGLVIGEGIGIVVLKRLSDAERDGDRIYAVIRGCGTSSDGRGASLMSPTVRGQVLALERAWAESGMDPGRIGLIEAHGTGTPAGDVAELTTLARFFGPPEDGAPRAVLGSVKSMIGHAMPAAGAAGLIKAALAIYHGALLPTLHCQEPHAELDATRFRVTGNYEGWAANGAPRVAGVNAFGFGGINAHVVLEEYAVAAKPPRRSAPQAAPSERMAVFSAPTTEALLADIASARERANGGPVRAIVIAPTEERLTRASEIVKRGKAWRGRERIWFSPHGLLAAGGTLAFVFPGIDALFEPRVEDVARAFGLSAPAAAESDSIQSLGLRVFQVNRLLNAVLRELGVRPAHVAGHSLGEWSAMGACGMMRDDQSDALLTTLDAFKVSEVAFAAAGCGIEAAHAAIEGLEDITISHDNCPHQVILCGGDAAIDEAVKRLIARGAFAQKLPFRSGFHSPHAAPFLEAYRDLSARLTYSPPQATLWSATTCEPYPADDAELRSLLLEHLVRPVRFRELIERLHGEGVRVFVQVGTGTVTNFIEDTLRGREHLAIAANAKERTGMEQLQRLAAALFVEGADVDLARLSPRTAAQPPMPLALSVPLAKRFTALAPAAQFATVGAPEVPVLPNGAPQGLAGEFTASFAALAEAQREVLARFAAVGTGGSRRDAPPARDIPPARDLAPLPVTASTPSLSASPAARRTTVRLTLERYPELFDHVFYAQRPGWPTPSDMRPIVPMTMSLDLMLEHAQPLAPGKVAVALEDVRMLTWLVVDAPTDITIDVEALSPERVRVRIEGYSEGTVVFADRYPDAPADDRAPLADARDGAGEAERIYAEGWMFHGPAYAGITRVDAIGSDAIRGELTVPSGRGAALDNAGQLFGMWGVRRLATDQMTLPSGIKRLTFFGPPPAVGERLGCTARVRTLADKNVTADLTVSRGERVWVAAEGWDLRRFDTDPKFWAIIRQGQHNLLAETRPEGFTFFEDRYVAAFTRDQLMRRFLGESERERLARLAPRAQRPWLAGRVAAKDAVRALLLRAGVEPLFPAEITIANDAAGKPVVRVAGSERDVRVSLAHKERLAVAIAAEGRDVGIDLERIEPRDDAFAALAFVPEELALIVGLERAEGLTRLWVAKEAVAKARGTGLGGNPRAFVVRERDGERYRIDDRWIETTRQGDFIIGWTP